MFSGAKGLFSSDMMALAVNLCETAGPMIGNDPVTLVHLFFRVLTDRPSEPSACHRNENSDAGPQGLHYMTKMMPAKKLPPNMAANSLR